MEGECAVRRDIVLAIDAEEPLARFQRLGLLILGVLSGMGAAYFLLNGDSLILTICIGLGFFLSIASRIGVRRMLVARNHDFYTVGGELDRAIRWDEVEQIKTVGTGAEVILTNGKRRPLRMPFLNAPSRNAALIRLIRHLEIFRLYGPLRLPTLSKATIPSEKISLRPVETGDRDICAAIAISEDSFEYQLAGTGTREMAESVFDESLATYLQGQEWWMFMILVNGDRVGTISLHVNDPILRQAQLGIDIRSPFQNLGHGSEAIRTVLDFFRTHSNLTLISAGCFSENLRCGRALEKAGMKRAGSYAKFWIKGDSWRSGERYEIEFQDSAEMNHLEM